MYSCRILADSVSPEDIRLTTFEVTFPRFILAEFNTHRMLSRNSASSRAIPTEKLIEQVRHFPFIPDFNRRVKGMGVGEPLSPIEAADRVMSWDRAREAALTSAQELIDLDKSRVNRLLEPFMWHTALASATDWSNFFALRTASNAQPEFRKLAVMMQETYEQNAPWYCPASCWHLPLVNLEELGEAPDYRYWKQVCTGRCARVSYLTHDGKRDPAQDVGLHNGLLTDHHMSPFEHPAHPFTSGEWEIIHETQQDLREHFARSHPKEVEVWCRQLEYSGNFHGWKQYRGEVPGQHDYSLGG